MHWRSFIVTEPVGAAYDCNDSFTTSAVCGAPYLARRALYSTGVWFIHARATVSACLFSWTVGCSRQGECKNLGPCCGHSADYSSRDLWSPALWILEVALYSHRLPALGTHGAACRHTSPHSVASDEGSFNVRVCMLYRVFHYVLARAIYSVSTKIKLATFIHSFIDLTIQKKKVK